MGTVSENATPAKSALDDLIDRGSVVYLIAGLFAGFLGMPWWVPLALGILAEVGLTAGKGMITGREVAWPSRNHVLLDLLLLMMAFFFGAWLDPFHFA